MKTTFVKLALLISIVFIIEGTIAITDGYAQAGKYGGGIAVLAVGGVFCGVGVDFLTGVGLDARVFGGFATVSFIGGGLFFVGGGSLLQAATNEMAAELQVSKTIATSKRVWGSILWSAGWIAAAMLPIFTMIHAYDGRLPITLGVIALAGFISGAVLLGVGRLDRYAEKNNLIPTSAVQLNRLRLSRDVHEGKPTRINRLDYPQNRKKFHLILRSNFVGAGCSFDY